MERYNEVLVRLVRIALGTACGPMSAAAAARGSQEDLSCQQTAEPRINTEPRFATNPSLGRKLSAKEWEAVYGAAMRHSIIGVLLPAIESLPAEERPPMGVAYQWLSDQTQIRLKNDKLRLRAAELNHIFIDAGFRTHVLKGITLASFYPDPSIRQCGDIDLWVDCPSGVEDGKKCTPNAQRREIIRFLKSRVSVGEILYHHCDAKFFDDVEVEVHYRPSWFYNPIFNHRFCAFIDAHRDRVFGSQHAGIKHACDSPSGSQNPEGNAARAGKNVVFELVYNLVHIFRHIFHEGVGLRHLIDYFYVLMASNPDERAEAFEVLQGLGLEKFCAAMMYIETAILGLPEEFSLCGPLSPCCPKSAAGRVSDSDDTAVLSPSLLRAAEVYGRNLFNEILQTGNFGMMDHRSEGRIRKVFRFFMLSPLETLCAIPWKCGHLGWRATHNLFKY